MEAEAAIMVVMIALSLVTAILAHRYTQVLRDTGDIWKALKQHVENNQRENKTIWNQLAEHDERMKGYDNKKEGQSIPASKQEERQ